MARIRSCGAQYASHMRNRLEGLEGTLDRVSRWRTPSLDGRTRAARARIVEARREAADKRRRIVVLLEGVPRVDVQGWPEVRRALDDAWTDYRDALERARLELERGRPW